VQLPEKLLQSLEGIKGFDREAFEKVHASGEQVTSIRINPLKSSVVSRESSVEHVSHDSRFTFHEKIPWSEFGYYLAERPSFTFDPLFHAGCYYVQEASSMFIEQAFKQTVDLSQPLKILDLSAAPGGKSTHIQSLISQDSLLVSNEVIRSRANVLKDNIIKWGCENVMVTNNDPKDFGRLEKYFDVIVVDAPCSGSGLFRREPEAINEWSENNVVLCGQRQQRILADVLPSLKKDGTLIYCTCSYSKEEDEEILDWMVKELKLIPIAIGSEKLKVENSWGIIEAESKGGAYGYRFWPDKIKGEGFFIACFKKTAGDESIPGKIRTRVNEGSKKEMTIIEKWVKKNNHRFIKHEDTVYAWPESLVTDMGFILSHCKVIYSGVRTGELVRDKLIPGHGLAMSMLVPGLVGRIELNYEQAIQYLQRKDIGLDAKEKGWHLVNYEGHSLGWINVLPNRINNYYPKELRILKDNPWSM
jgi:16S rRNA C967 or C1407 C5-methylase (RsmB/RsmF family)/NOL1/NOP2/fmu family ribosome biogenesis protein